MKRDMEDNLEEFIKSRKAEFDDLIPNESVWKGINQELQIDNSKANQLFIWKAAAMILLVLSVGLTLFINRDVMSVKENAVVFDDEFLTTESYYTSEINSRQQLIKTVAQTYPDIEQDFEQDWKVLDVEYGNLKKEYEINQNEEVRSALVQNLRARVNLLNRQLQVLEQIENKESNIVEI